MYPSGSLQFWMFNKRVFGNVSVCLSRRAKQNTIMPSDVTTASKEFDVDHSLLTQGVKASGTLKCYIRIIF